MSETAVKHKAKAPTEITFSVIIVSSSRFQKLLKKEKVEDPSGDMIVSLLKNSGHSVISKRIVADNKVAIKKSILNDIDNPDVDAIIVSGGTGISSTDVTFEAVEPLLNKFLPGFGELLRKTSYEQIGSPAILTRAIAGLIENKPIFCIPGSPQAVETALNNFIILEVGHILRHVRE